MTAMPSVLQSPRLWAPGHQEAIIQSIHPAGQNIGLHGGDSVWYPKWYRRRLQKLLMQSRLLLSGHVSHTQLLPDRKTVQTDWDAVVLNDTVQ